MFYGTNEREPLVGSCDEEKSRIIIKECLQKHFIFIDLYKTTSTQTFGTINRSTV